MTKFRVKIECYPLFYDVEAETEEDAIFEATVKAEKEKKWLVSYREIVHLPIIK